MDSNIAETLQMLIGFGGTIVVIISILKYRLRHKELEKGGSHELEEQLDALRLEMQDLRAEQAEQLADVQERLEFAERLLTKGGHAQSS